MTGRTWITRRSGMSWIRLVCLLAALMMLTLLIPGCTIGLSQFQKDMLEYLGDNHSPIDSFADDGDYAALAPLKGLAESSQVLFYGEYHGIADNYWIVLKMMKYLHGLGYRYLVLEGDFTDTDRYNEYLVTGDEYLLTSMDKWQKTKFEMNSVEGLEFFRELRKWNLSLPEADRITIWAADVAMQYAQAKERIVEQVARVVRPAAVPRLVGLLNNRCGSYADVKSFETELEREIAGLDGKNAELLRLQVRALKDAYADQAASGDKAVEADYPNRRSIRDHAMAALYDGLWRWSNAPETGKVFAHMGAGHGDFSYDSFGRILREEYPPTKGRVSTVAGLPLSGQYRTEGGSLGEALAGGSGVTASLARRLVRLGHPYTLNLMPAGQKLSYSAVILIGRAVPVHDR